MTQQDARSDSAALSGWLSRGSVADWQAELSPSTKLSAAGHLCTFSSAEVEIAVFGCLTDRVGLAGRLNKAPADLGTDAQTVAELYRHEHLGLFDQISGDFAIVIVDRDHKIVVLARNHAGTRPLFYTEEHAKVRFGTDLASVAPAPGVGAEIDPKSLNAFLNGTPPPSGQTMAMGVKSVPPAHYVLASYEGISTVRYWDPHAVTERSIETTEAAATELADLLAIVVDEMTPETGVMGVHLTGGLDSSATAALLVGTLTSRNADAPRAYAWQSPPADGNLTDVDRELIQLMGTHLDIEVNYIPLTLERLLTTLAIDPVSQPATSTLTAERPVMEAAEAHGVTHLVSGWGGDEFISQNTPSKVTGLARARVLAGRLRRRLPATARKRMLRHLTRGHLHERADSWSIHGASHGLQYLYPLLDRRVIEFALSLSPEIHASERALMREALKGLVPDPVRLNTDKSEPGRSSVQFCVAAALRDRLGALPLDPDRFDAIGNDRLATIRASKGDVPQPGKFLRAIQVAYDPNGKPYDELVDR